MEEKKWIPVDGGLPSDGSCIVEVIRGNSDRPTTLTRPENTKSV